MQFQAKSEQEIAESRLLPKGEYDFEILDAEEKTSKAANSMIVLKVRVSNGNGVARTLTDYLVAQSAGKLRNCCAACGILDKYDNGVVSEDDFPGKRGRLKLVVEKKRGWPARNVIADYVAA
jgi:Protein of unknown function (DUF669)